MSILLRASKFDAEDWEQYPDVNQDKVGFYVTNKGEPPMALHDGDWLVEFPSHDGDGKKYEVFCDDALAAGFDDVPAG